MPAPAIIGRERRGCDRCVSITVDGPEGQHHKSCGCACTLDGCPHATAPWPVQQRISDRQRSLRPTTVLALKLADNQNDRRRLARASVRLRNHRWRSLEGQRGYPAGHANSVADEHLLHPRWGL